MMKMARVNVTNSHLKLLQHLHFKFDQSHDYGMIRTDGKRPFRNSGVMAIHEDMVKILKGEKIDDPLDILFSDLAFVVQLMVAKKANFMVVQPGIYELARTPAGQWHAMKVTGKEKRTPQELEKMARQAVMDQDVECPECGATLDPDQEMCPECGTDNPLIAQLGW
jgi:hypothetical protein